MNLLKPIANSDTAPPRGKARILIQSAIPAPDLALTLSGLLDQYPLERPAVVLIEGLYADPALEVLENTAKDIRLVRLGFGCPCCIGSLPLRVALTRLLRELRPALMVLAVRDIKHQKALAEQLREQFHADATVEIAVPHDGGGALLAQSPLKSS